MKPNPGFKNIRKLTQAELNLIQLRDQEIYIMHELETGQITFLKPSSEQSRVYNVMFSQNTRLEYERTLEKFWSHE